MSEVLESEMRLSELDWRTGDRQDGYRWVHPESDDINWALSPDGETIAATEHTDRLFLLPVAQPERRRTIEVLDIDHLQYVAFKPDGSGLYVTGISGGLMQLLEVDFDGRSRRLWSHPRHWINRPRPSPDGSRLAFGLLRLESDLCVLEGFE